MKICPSNPPLKRRRLSGAKAKQNTEEMCLLFISVGAMGVASFLRLASLIGHRRTILSYPPEAKNFPSLENSNVLTYSEWPSRFLQWNETVTPDSLRWTARHLAAKTPRESPCRVCPDSLPSSSAAAASAVLFTDLLPTHCTAIGCSTGPCK